MEQIPERSTDQGHSSTNKETFLDVDHVVFKVRSGRVRVRSKRGLKLPNHPKDLQ